MKTKPDNKTEVFETLPIPRALRVMIFPAVISQLIVLIYNMADTFYVGQTNNPYMVAATSLILPVFNITLCLAGAGIILGGVLNIILDPLFMFVLLPDGYEVLGAGIATCLSNCIACIFFFFVLFRMGSQSEKSTITFSLRAGKPQKESVTAVFAVGIPSAIATLLFDLDYVVIDRLMVSYHDLALAAVGIVLKVERFPLNVGIGICQGMMPLVAYNYAAKNRKRMEDTIRLSRMTGLVIAGISIILYEIFAAQFIRIFISDAQTIELATDFLRIRVLATPLMFLSFFTVYLFQAFGKGKISLFLGVMRWLVFNIPMLFILNGIFGMYGIVWSQVTADILTVALSFYVYHRFGPGWDSEKRIMEERG